MEKIKLTNNKSASVEELVKALIKVKHKDYIIRTEGCDCYGNAVYLEVDHKLNRVDICRGDNNE